MADSTLSLTYDDLLQAVAYYLGWGSTIASLSDAQTAHADRIIQSGYRQFLVPPALERGKPSHRWSFLSPIAELVTWISLAVDDDETVTGTYLGGVTTITASSSVFYPSMVGKTLVVTDAGSVPITGYTSGTVVTALEDYSWVGAKTYALTCDGNYRLPDDFGGLVGDLTYEEAGKWPPVRTTGEGRIRAYRSQSTLTGRPAYAATRPVEVAVPSVAGQRFDLLIWPLPDEVRTLLYRYNRLVRKLTTTDKYPVGGMQHAETLLESCLAAAEVIAQDAAGVHQALWQQRLEASVALDLQTQVPDFFGYNGNVSGSDGMDTYRTKWVTVYGERQ